MVGLRGFGACGCGGCCLTDYGVEGARVLQVLTFRGAGSWLRMLGEIVWTDLQVQHGMSSSRVHHKAYKPKA